MTITFIVTVMVNPRAWPDTLLGTRPLIIRGREPGERNQPKKTHHKKIGPPIMAQKIAAKADFWMIFCQMASKSPGESVLGARDPKFGDLFLKNENPKIKFF